MLQHLSNVLIPKVEDIRVDEVADQVEKELHDMDKAIEAAALKIEEMLANTRTRDSGVKLEVNAKILDSCTTLMTVNDFPSDLLPFFVLLPRSFF